MIKGKFGERLRSKSHTAQVNEVLCKVLAHNSGVEVQGCSCVCGRSALVSGLAPLSLVVGNANGVQLTHNEQPVNLEPYIKVDVARLTLK